MSTPLPPNRKSPTLPVSRDAGGMDIDPKLSVLKLDHDDRAEFARELLRSLTFKERGLILGEFAPVPNRSKTTVNSDFVYVFKLEQDDSTLSSLVHLVHSDAFKQHEIDAMAAEASKIVNEVRLPTMRKDWADRRFPMPKDEEGVRTLNDNVFQQHATFFEAVLCDKFNFRRLHISATRTQIETTVRLSR